MKDKPKVKKQLLQLQTATYDKQVAGYIVKEKAGKDFAKLTCMLDNFWRAVEFPSPKE